MARYSTPLPPSLPECFSVAEGIAAGMTRRRLRSRDLSSRFHGARRARFRETSVAETQGLYSQAEFARVHSLAAEYLTVMPSHAFFCGRTAAALWQLPVDCDESLEVGVFSPRSAPTTKGVRGRRVASHLVSVQTFDGMPVSSPASTWAMLARALTERELVMLGDAIIRVPRGEGGHLLPMETLATVEQLESAIAAGNRAGGTLLRSALSKIRVGSASPLETEFRLDASALGLPLPELDFDIRGPSGVLLGISEIAFPQFRTAVEIEGDHHRTSRRQWHRDIEKYQSYAEIGWEVVRLTSKHVRDPRRSGVETVRAALLRRGWTGIPPARSD